MIGKEFGIKRACQNCGAKFFDLKKKVPTCPECGTEFVAVKTRTRKTANKQEKEVGCKIPPRRASHKLLPYQNEEFST